MKHAETIAAVALLVVAAVIMYVTTPPSNAGEACCGVSALHGELMVDAGGPVAAVEPVGPADAPVRIAVFYEAGNACHEFIAPEARKLAARYAPHVRLAFAPWHAPGTAKLARELAVGCLVEVSVTGPVPEDGPEPETVSFTGPTEIGAWNWDEVGHAIERRLATAGVNPTPKPVGEDESADVAGANDAG